MPKRFSIELPSVDQREKILRLVCILHSLAVVSICSYLRQMLKDTSLAPDFPIHALVEETRGLSGSDLKELCRNAAMRPMREFIREAGGDHALMTRSQEEVCADHATRWTRLT